MPRIARTALFAIGCLAISVPPAHAEDRPTVNNTTVPVVAAKTAKVLVFGAANSGVVSGQETGGSVSMQQLSSATVTADTSFAALGLGLFQADVTTAAIANVLSTADLDTGGLATRQATDAASLSAMARLDLGRTLRSETQVVAMANLSNHVDLEADSARVRQRMTASDSTATLTVTRNPEGQRANGLNATAVSVGNAANLAGRLSGFDLSLDQRTTPGATGGPAQIASTTNATVNNADGLELWAVALGNTASLELFASGTTAGGVGASATLITDQQNGVGVRAQTKAKARGADRRGAVQAVAAGNALVVSG